MAHREACAVLCIGTVQICVGMIGSNNPVVTIKNNRRVTDGVKDGGELVLVHICNYDID